MPGKPVIFRNHKERGEWTELKFMARAQELGFRVNKPYGDSAPYDVAVEERGRFQRVQVKCTDHFDEYAYRSVFHSNERRYTKEEVDFFGIYVIPEKAWYIFPAEVLIGLRFSVRLNPRNPKQKYARYLEAWPLLRSEGRPEESERASTSGSPPASADVVPGQVEARGRAGLQSARMRAPAAMRGVLPGTTDGGEVISVHSSGFSQQSHSFAEGAMSGASRNPRPGEAWTGCPLTGRQRRSFRRRTNFKPDQTSVTAQTLTSTRPAASPMSRTIFSVRSDDTPEVFFGHETQRVPAGVKRRARPLNSSFNSACDFANTMAKSSGESLSAESLRT
jgi:PD-(D/E)XK endonuclease